MSAIAPALAKNEYGVVRTWSPALIPAAINAKNKASVPEAQPMANRLVLRFKIQQWNLDEGLSHFEDDANENDITITFSSDRQAVLEALESAE